MNEAGDTGLPDEINAPTDLKTQALRGAKWSLLEKWLSRAFTFGTFAVLGHLLAPQAFGLVALAMTVVTLVNMIVDSGASEALVRRATLSKELLDTAFWMAFGTGLLLCGLICLLADPIASALGEPELADILRVLSIAFPIQGLTATQQALLQRDMNFKSLAFRRLIATCAGGVVGLVWAAIDPSVWALVGQFLVQASIALVILWTMADYRPGKAVNRSAAKELLAFGSGMLGIKLLSFMSEQGDNFVVGILLGPTALGYYVVGFRIFAIATELITSTLSSVALPTFSRLQDDLPRLSKAVLSATRVSTAIAAPFFLGMAVLAPQIIPIAFGDQWDASVPVMQILSVVGLLNSVTFFDRSVLVAVGRVRTEFLITLSAGIGNIVAYVIGSHWGIEGVAIALVARAYLFWPIRLLALRSAIGINLARYLGQWIRPVIGGAVLVAVMWPTAHALPDLLGIPIAGALGGVAYLAVLRLIAPQLLREVTTLGRRSKRTTDDPIASDSP